MLQQLEAKQQKQDVVNAEIEQAIINSDAVTAQLAATMNKQADTLAGLQNGMMNLNGKFDTLTHSVADTNASLGALTTQLQDLFDLVTRQAKNSSTARPTDDGDEDPTHPPAANKRKVNVSS